MMHRHTSQLFRRRNIALIAIVAISAFALLYPPARSTFTQAVYSVAPWIWNVGGEVSTSLSSLVANFRNKDALITENETLNEAIKLMETQVLDRNLLAERVIKLEEALGRARSDDRVIASVLAGPGRSPYDMLIIDIGTEQGINVGNMAVYADSGVIGQVVEVTAESSKVKLLSSPGEEHAVIVGSHYLPVVALGRGMGNFEAKVPQNSAVFVGDNVVTTKGNLVVGRISVIEERPAEPIKRIFFRLPFNIAEIRSVEIIKTKE